MKRRRWTEEELTFLREHWEALDDASLAAKLGRPMNSVTTARLQLRLKRPRASGLANRYTRHQR
jgi:hypothetical protein